ncbi:hypothetical protein ACFOEK_00930 [Litoribrevibacter euphylliae]|uniref:Uncharacterized protein n=1 Tax=Litoribrevibacter euphylliae TaxID=1834034 RepID=A0ABV7H6Q2_9GAMM
MKVGKKHPRWQEAAEFILERATPEVKLLVSVGRQLEREEMLKERLENTSSLPIQQIIKYVLIALLCASVSGVSGYILANAIKFC